MTKQVFFISALLFLLSCGKDTPEPAVITSPTPANVLLIFPLENSECNEGSDVSDIESTVRFEWKRSENADAYELVVLNLATDELKSYATAETKIPVVLQRAAPYAWYVIARSAVTDSTGRSDVWKFYNSGEGIQSYAPFPAEIISPKMSETVNAMSGSITLEWKGNDVDNDIVSYDVNLGTTNPPALLQENITETTLSGVRVDNNSVYYWNITTHDAAGNQSSTGVFQFRVP